MHVQGLKIPVHVIAVFSPAVNIANGGIIQGFLVQARLPNDTPLLGTGGMLLGSFQPGSGQRTYNCDMIGAATEVSNGYYINVYS